MTFVTLGCSRLNDDNAVSRATLPRFSDSKTFLTDERSLHFQLRQDRGRAGFRLSGTGTDLSIHARSPRCGILGGNRVDFLIYYAAQAIFLLGHPHNQQGLAVLRNRSVT